MFGDPGASCVFFPAVTLAVRCAINAPFGFLYDQLRRSMGFATCRGLSKYCRNTYNVDAIKYIFNSLHVWLNTNEAINKTKGI